MTTHQATAEKAHQLREKQAAALADAHKMEQQRLKRVAKKKEGNQKLMKVEKEVHT